MERQVCRMSSTRDRYALVRVSRDWRRRYLPEACMCHGSVRYGLLVYDRLDLAALRNMDPRMAWEIVYQIWQTGRPIRGSALGLPSIICDGFLNIPENINMGIVSRIYHSPYWYRLPAKHITTQTLNDMLGGYIIDPTRYRKWITIINKASLTVSLRTHIIINFAIKYPHILSDFLEKIWQSLGPDPRCHLQIVDERARDTFNEINGRFQFWPLTRAI